LSCSNTVFGTATSPFCPKYASNSMLGFFIRKCELSYKKRSFDQAPPIIFRGIPRAYTNEAKQSSPLSGVHLLLIALADQHPALVKFPARRL
jgi:hypothetical protein